MSEYPIFVTSELKLKCLQCDRSFLRGKALERHSLAHPQLRCHCNRCNGSMNMHKFFRKNASIYNCRKCGAEFDTPETLSHHTEREHKKQQHYCAICRERFNEQWQLTVHIGKSHYKKKAIKKGKAKQAEEAEEVDGAPEAEVAEKRADSVSE